MDLGDRYEADFARPLKEFAVTITAHLADEGSPSKSWTVRGKVGKTFRVPSHVLDCGHELTRGKPSVHRFEIQSLRPVPDLKVTCDHPEVRAAAGGPYGEGRDRFRVEIQLPPRKSIGPFRFEAVLRAGSPADGWACEQRVPVIGTVQDTIRVTPARIDSGAVPVGTSVEDAVSLASVDGERFEVLSWSAVGPDVVVSPLEEPPLPGQGRPFRITQTPSRPGPNSTEVLFRVRSDGDERVIRLNAGCYGIRE